MDKPFITIYGINNLGKTTQAELLVKRINESGQSAELFKYPVYRLEPSGKYLDQILRQGQKISSPREMELWFVVNRHQAAPILDARLRDGVVVSEDYIGTGIAWGMAYGASRVWMEEINKYLRKEDLAILLDGERFDQAVEDGHINETNDELIKKCRKAHLDLAKRYGWSVVKANDTIDNIHENIWKIVNKKFKFS